VLSIPVRDFEPSHLVKVTRAIPRAADVVGGLAWVRVRWSPVAVVALAIALSAPAAVASEPLSGYGNTPSTSSTTTPPAPPPEPSKETTSPSQENVKPTESDETNPVQAAREVPPRQLPSTGYDLRGELGLGLLLVAAGAAILIVHRRKA
jgi:hypothetical protein